VSAIEIAFASAMAQAMRDLRYFTARRATAQLLDPIGDLGTVVFGRWQSLNHQILIWRL
jgi:hypothetical protein